MDWFRKSNSIEQNPCYVFNREFENRTFDCVRLIPNFFVSSIAFDCRTRPQSPFMRNSFYQRCNETFQATLPNLTAIMTITIYRFPLLFLHKHTLDRPLISQSNQITCTTRSDRWCYEVSHPRVLEDQPLVCCYQAIQVWYSENEN